MLRDSESLQNLIDLLDDKETELVSFDLETDGVEEHLCRIIGIAIATATDHGYYIPLAEFDKETKALKVLWDEETERELVEILCDILIDKKLVMHNGVFDIACMYHSYGIDLTPAMYHDTMLSKHTVDEERPFGLKEIGEMLFGEGARDEQLDLAESVKKNGGRWTKTKKDIWMGDPDLVAKYAIKDVMLTAEVYMEFEEEMEKQGLDAFYYDQEVMPLYRKATIPMKLTGVFTDVNYFEDLKKEVEGDIIRLTNEVFEIIGEDIQPKVRELLDKAVSTSRTGQFAEELLRLNNLPVPLNKKTGKPTFAKTALRQIEASEAPGDPIFKWLLWEHPKIEVLVEEEQPITNEEGEVVGSELVEVVKKVKDPDVIEPALPEDMVYQVKKEIFTRKNPDKPEVFNLASTAQLGWLLFEVYKQEPTQFSRQTCPR